ncbi:WD40-repeat-containing domain protein [Jimgerdemannia flammicorona]|uniref:WD40-repeat-containing domain protein n=1 Tax=Jimgerdemannia flammicorona TaxID=994334 RepID=A0A433CYR6_9FUNG|nr:WD40-repeat-containing domain protein [Jimgerdemannia flammicorona]
MSAPMDLDPSKPSKRPEPSLSNLLARPRVHFGSIEETERQKRAKSEDSNEVPASRKVGPGRLTFSCLSAADVTSCFDSAPPLRTGRKWRVDGRPRLAPYYNKPTWPAPQCDPQLPPTLAEEDTGMGLSESSARAREKHKAVLDEFERKKRARTIAVPTDDGRVRAKLRELGEPQCLFGEGPGDRRDRLRFLLSKMGGTDAMEVEEEEEESESEEEKDEEFYTPGTQELLEARRWMATYSLPKHSAISQWSVDVFTCIRARERLTKQRIEHEFPLPQLKSLRKDLHTHLKAFVNWSSQVADDRPVAQCSFSPDAKMIATGAWSGLCKIWSVPNCECLHTLRDHTYRLDNPNASNLGHNDRVGGVVFHPQSTISLDRGAANLASGAADGTVYLWSFDRDTPLASLSGHRARVARVGFHPSGRFLGTASYDSTWRLWDVETTQELLLQEGHSREVYAIGFQEDGALVASG